MTVLVLSDEHDPGVDRVVLGLTERGVEVFRADLGWFPTELTLDAQLHGTRWDGVLRTTHREVHLAEVRSVWYRRPTAFTFPAGLSAAQTGHAAREARFGLGGVLGTLPVTWLNHPQRDAEHAYKPRQLTVAARCGMATPRTLVTNNPHAVRSFAETCHQGMVIKVLASNVLHENGVRTIAHTHRLSADDLADVSGVDLTTHQFQEWVPKAHEVRVVVVGDALFAVAIHTDDPRAHIDWRADYDALHYERTIVPDHLATAIRQFMGRCGLLFSALDFVVTPQGRWVFLESNSGGQYGWLKTVLGSAISDAITDLLAGDEDHD